jgi:hypothetical protein
MNSFLRKSIVGFLGAILSIAFVIAQASECSELVQTALESAEDNCSELGRNELCYGFDNVQARFITEVAEDYFTHISDRSPVADLVSVQTLPMDTDLGDWGVAVMNLQANVPNSIPGQNVTFVLMGNVELENEVAPEDVFVPSDGIEIHLAVNSANLRSGAGLDFNVIGGVGRNETIIADGISENEEWLRVVKNEQPAWLNRTLIVDDPEIDNLPILTDDLHTPMQAFYLRTGIGQPECLEAPNDVLLVQSPENIEIELSINGAQVRLGSSGAFRVVDIDGAPFLETLVFDGEFLVDGTSVQTGQHSFSCLGDENSRGLDGQSNDLIVTCEPSEPEAIPNYGEDWCYIESTPDEILNYRLDVLCAGENAPTGGGSASQVAEVNCNSFAILTQGIPSTDFVFSWSAAAGADSYEVAVFDSNGTQISSNTTSGTSINLNGGVHFAPSGFVDVRAYRGGVYACFTRLNYSRGGDPNAAAPEGTESP